MDENEKNINKGKNYFKKALTGKESIKTGKVDLKKLLNELQEHKAETRAATSVKE